MIKKIFGLSMTLLILGFVQAVQAVPITGSLNFASNGTFTSTGPLAAPGDAAFSGVALDGSGDGLLGCANGDPIIGSGGGSGGSDNCSDEGGFDTGPATGFDFGPLGPFGESGFVTAASGSLASDYGIGFATLLGLSDFDLNKLPTDEWVVTISTAIDGILKFVITSGGESDISDTGAWDLSGNGIFVFECDGTDTGCVDETTTGEWRVAFAGGASTISFNAVPAPPAIAILGLGLLGLGIARRRRLLSR